MMRLARDVIGFSGFEMEPAGGLGIPRYGTCEGWGKEVGPSTGLGGGKNAWFLADYRT